MVSRRKETASFLFEFSEEGSWPVRQSFRSDKAKNTAESPRCAPNWGKAKTLHLLYLQKHSPLGRKHRGGRETGLLSQGPEFKSWPTDSPQEALDALLMLSCYSTSHI